jgi:hypothetical protein
MEKDEILKLALEAVNDVNNVYCSTDPKNADKEMFCAVLHKMYCEQHFINNGKQYRTNGDYSLLDKPTKDYDRCIVLFIDKYIGYLSEKGKGR